MTSFSKSRDKLQRLRDKQQKLLQQQYTLRQKINHIADEAEDSEPKVQRALMGKQKNYSSQYSTATQKLKQAEQLLDASVQDFQALGQPQLLVENLNDGIPFLLMPVKLETRFVTVRHVTRKFDKTDIFDSSTITAVPQPPSPVPQNGKIVEIPELTSLKAGIYRNLAQKIETRIAKGTFTPTKELWLPKMADKKELWVRIYPDDIFVNDHEPALLTKEVEAGQTYWKTIWITELEFQKAKKKQAEQAQTDTNQQRTNAWTVLQRRFKSGRSKWIIQSTQPENFVAEQTDYTQPPQFSDIATKAAAWTQAAKTNLLPDNFVVRLYTGNNHKEITGNPVDQDLILGLDPENDEFSETDDQLELPEKLRWINDFKIAETKGMAIRIPLSIEEFSKGFDRLVVLGVKLSVDEKKSQSLLEQLFYNHQYRPENFSLLPQGTPTNNTESKNNTESIEEQETKAYLRWSEGGLFNQEAKVGQRKDGQWLTDALGIEHSVFQRVLNSDGTDISESLAMNKLLWPGTMGYFLRQFLSPLINDKNLSLARDYFSRYVSGRGQLPCIRVGDQPYGVLATTAFSRLKYLATTTENNYYQPLFQRILKNLDRHWASMVPSVLQVADQLTQSDRFSNNLMQLLGLHANSVDFYVRTLVDPFFAEDVIPISVDNEIEDDYWKIMNNLKGMGFYFHAFEDPTRIFDMLHSQDVRPLDGPLIDALPLSEQRKVQPLPDSDQHYLDWLAKGDVLNDLKAETSNLDNNQGIPLLYLLLRHGIVREYINTALDLLKQKGIFSPVADIDQEREELDTLGANHEYTLTKAIELKWQFVVYDKIELLCQKLIKSNKALKFIVEFDKSVLVAFDFFSDTNYLRSMVSEAATKLRSQIIKPSLSKKQLTLALGAFVKDVEEAIEIAVERELKATINGLQEIHPDKWKVLSVTYEQVSGTKTMLEFVNDQLKSNSASPELKFLAEMKTAFDTIKDLPTARLERLLVEHIDCCNYRLDAWMTALVNQRLDQQRTKKPKGVYLGAFGYLEDIRIGSIPGEHVEEIVKPKRLSLIGNKSAFNEICVPVLNFKSLNVKPGVIDTMLKNAFVYLGGQANVFFDYNAIVDNIQPKPHTDDDGEGFLHTPSTTHANTAAILRSGYATYKEGKDSHSATDPLAVNLSSHRVRMALYFLEGIRNGQELGALLGYQFERALHEYADQKPVNTSFVSKIAGYLFQLRQHFPLQTLSREDGAEGNENVFSVVDGRALLNKFQQQKNKTHWSIGVLDNCPPTDRNLLDLELSHLEENLDALSDLLMAESVYQMTKGNTERSAAAMRALNDGGKIDTPEIIDTPRRGFNYLQRVGVMLNSLNNKPNAWNTSVTPRAFINPQINQWLSRQLPAPSRIIINIKLEDETNLKWPLSNADFQPIDLVYMLQDQQGFVQDSLFFILLKEQVRIKNPLRSDTLMTIDIKDKTGFTSNQISLFELLPLFESLARLLQHARPMFPEDLVVPSEVTQTLSSGEIVFDNLKQGLNQILANGGDFSLGIQQDKLQNQLEQLVNNIENTQAEQKYDQLYRSLLETSNYGYKEAVPSVERHFSPANLTALGSHATNIIQQLDKKLESARTLISTIGDDLSPRDQWTSLSEIAQQIFGNAFKLFPEFKPVNAPVLTKALNRDSLKNSDQTFIVEDWLQGVSLVRSPVKPYSQLSALREGFNCKDQAKKLQIIQLPDGNSPWIASNLPGEELINGDTLSVAIEVESAINAQNNYIGLIIDEWYEQIPDETISSGVTFNYNQPDCEAPQTLLLAVSPNETGSWQWDDLMLTITETMEMAKKRAVDPELLNDSSLANFLPAVTAPINDQNLVPATDFAKNIKINPGVVK